MANKHDEEQAAEVEEWGSEKQLRQNLQGEYKYKTHNNEELLREKVRREKKCMVRSRESVKI